MRETTSIPPSVFAPRGALRSAGELAGRDVVVAGEGEGPLRATLALLPVAASVTLVETGGALEGDGATARAVRAAAASLQVLLIEGRVCGGEADGDRLLAVKIATSRGEVSVTADHLLADAGLVTAGATPDADAPSAFFVVGDPPPRRPPLAFLAPRRGVAEPPVTPVVHPPEA